MGSAYDENVLGKLVLLRHGQSTWNELNLFTGWHDVPLSAQGLEEAAAAGAVMAEAGLSFDVAHTSLLTRAVMTCHLALNGMGQVWLPVERHWKWNERHYGALQGLDKKATTEQHGEAQTKVWRRSFDVPPPPIDPKDTYAQQGDPRYSDIEAFVPKTESLKIVIDRMLPYWHSDIATDVSVGKVTLVVAHGNSLRGLVKHLEGISDDDIAELNIPTGIPLVYDLDNDLKPKKPGRYLDPEAAKAGAAAVAGQGKKKR